MKNRDRITQIETQFYRKNEKHAEDINNIRKICDKEGCQPGTKHAESIVENIRKLEIKQAKDMEKMEKEINKIRQDLAAMGKKIILIQIVVVKSEIVPLFGS